jgi:hypothetical protein
MRARVRAGRRLLTLGLLPLAFLGAASCGPSVDLKQALEITELAGGWFDAGIVDGQNKLVPSVAMRVRKKMDVRLAWVSLNLVFRKKVDANTEESSNVEDVFLQRVEFTEGSQTPVLTVRAQHGYTGEAPQTRAEMLNNSRFQDMRVVIFAKQSSADWVELTRFDIPRVLLTK